MRALIRYLFYCGLIGIAITLVRVFVLDDQLFRMPPTWTAQDVLLGLLTAIAFVLPLPRFMRQLK